jgi:hypothetical protein
MQQQIEEQKYLNYITEDMLKVFNKTDANLDLLTNKVNEMYTKLDSIGLNDIKSDLSTTNKKSINFI